MLYAALGRAVAIALATVLVFGLVLIREATSPSGAGYWRAMAAAPEGDLYLADEVHRELRLVHPGGGWERLAAVPGGVFRALAADGPNLLLATEGRLYVSTDTGSSWRAAMPGRFTAVAVRGSTEYAAAWADGIYLSEDAGATWSKAVVPAGDTEFQALIPGFAGTLLGLLESTDGGHSWARVAGIPDRITAVSYNGNSGLVRAGDWRGVLWLYDPLRGEVAGRSSYPGGVEAVEGSVVATTGGVYPDRGGPLHGREVTRLVLSGDNYFAAAARGPFYVSGDGTHWRLAYQG